MITLIVAATKNNAIGKDNKMMWHLPNDLKFFKNTTWGFPIIMGRKTFEAIGKPLPGRQNIVVTNNEDWAAEGVEKAASLEEAIEKAKEANTKEIFVAGGGKIYRQAIELADKILMTRVTADLDGDTFFPKISKKEWELVSDEPHHADEKHNFDYTFRTWVRKESEFFKLK